MRKRAGTGLALTATLALMAPMAAAQESAEFSRQTLSEYASLRDRMTELRADYREAIKDTRDRQAVQKRRQQMNDKMMAAIKDAGLSLEEYNAISSAIRDNPELEQQVRRMRDTSQ